jgi:hypothetical protein
MLVKIRLKIRWITNEKATDDINIFPIIIGLMLAQKVLIFSAINAHRFNKYQVDSEILE